MYIISLHFFYLSGVRLEEADITRISYSVTVYITLVTVANRVTVVLNEKQIMPKQ